MQSRVLSAATAPAVSGGSGATGDTWPGVLNEEPGDVKRVVHQLSDTREHDSTPFAQTPLRIVLGLSPSTKLVVCMATHHLVTLSGGNAFSTLVVDWALVDGHYSGGLQGKSGSREKTALAFCLANTPQGCDWKASLVGACCELCGLVAGRCVTVVVLESGGYMHENQTRRHNAPLNHERPGYWTTP